MGSAGRSSARAKGARLVAELAERLEREPDDVEGWLLLARSYMVLGQYDKGRDAYREAWTRTPEPDNELKVAYAESQILSDRAALGGDAGGSSRKCSPSSPATRRRSGTAGSSRSSSAARTS